MQSWELGRPRWCDTVSPCPQKATLFRLCTFIVVPSAHPPPAAPLRGLVSTSSTIMDQNNAPQRNVHNAYAMQRGAWAPPFNSRLGLNSMYSTVVVIVCGVQKQLTKRGAVHACGAAGCGELADRDDAVAAQEQLRGAPLLPLPAVVGR